MRQFDLIVIGTGSGLDVANAAASSGMEVAVIEKGRLGGTCLNRGCIPSKILIHSADVATTLRNAAQFGINVGEWSVDFEAIVTRTSQSVDEDSDRIEHSLKHHVQNPVLFQTEAHFVGDKTLQVGSEQLHAEKILIAAGGRPQIPSIPGLADSGYITSDEALRLTKQPRELIVLGGGYIAAELAYFYGALGTRVTVVHRHPVLIRREDKDIARRFTQVFGREHRLVLNALPLEVRRTGDRITLAVENRQTRKRIEVDGDTLLVATGRTPNTDTLNLDATGVQLTANGYVAVDEYLETNVTGIYALGDIVGRFLFKHSANYEAQYAYWNMVLGRRVAIDYEAMPRAIFSHPQVAGVGMTEQECKETGVDYVTSVYAYGDTAMGQALQEKDGFVKMIAQRSNAKILGCHIMGPDASTLIHEVIVAMKCGNGSVSNVLNAIHIHPALSEVVHRAANRLE